LCCPTCILKIGHVLEEAANGDGFPTIAIEAVAIAHGCHHEFGGTFAWNNFEIATSRGIAHGFQ